MRNISWNNYIYMQNTDSEPTQTIDETFTNSNIKNKLILKQS